MKLAIVVLKVEGEDDEAIEKWVKHDLDLHCERNLITYAREVLSVQVLRCLALSERMEPCS